MKHLTRSTLLLLAISFIIGCSSEQQQKQPVEEKISDNIELLTQLAINENDEQLTVIYLVSDTADWSAVRDSLVDRNKVLISSYAEVSKITMVGFSEDPELIGFEEDASVVWDADFHSIRLCALDNPFGDPRFAYGGVRTDEGREGDWKQMQFFENDKWIENE